MLNKIIAGVMVVCGLLTMSMLQAVWAPNAMLESLVQQRVSGALEAIVIPDWGVLVGTSGAMLIFGAFNPTSRRLCLAAAGAGKLAFVVLAFAYGPLQPGLMVPVVVDSVMVTLFALFLVLGRGGAATARPAAA